MMLVNVAMSLILVVSSWMCCSGVRFGNGNVVERVEPIPRFGTHACLAHSTGCTGNVVEMGQGTMLRFCGDPMMSIVR